MSDQERYCYYCNGDHKGTECPRRYPAHEMDYFKTWVKRMRDTVPGSIITFEDLFIMIENQEHLK